MLREMLLDRRDALKYSLATVGGIADLMGRRSVDGAQPIPRVNATWPHWHGALGNSGLPASDVRILDDLAKARLLWDSQEKDLPVGKLRSNGNPYSRPSGGMAGLIAAEQSVYFAYFQPCGKVEAANWRRPGVAADRLIAADDVVLCVDRANGRTRWKTVLADKGVNHAPTKRAGWAVTPAYHTGRVFSLGTTGRLYGLDANTSKLLWESHIGAFHERLEGMKKQALGQRQMGAWPTMRCSLTVSAGMLIVPTYLGARDIGIAGFDPASGKKMWELPNAAFNMAPPAVWRHEGREYLIAGTYAGHVRLIDPARGKVLWEFSGLGPQEENLAPSQTHLVVNVRAGEKAPKLYGALRIDLKEARRAWSLQDRAEFHAATGGDGAAYRRVSALGDRFAIHRVGAQDKGQRALGLWIVDAASGKVVQNFVDRIGAWPQSFHAIGSDRLLCVSDAAHCNPGFSILRLQGNELRHLGEVWTPTPKEQGSSGYEVPMQYPILDGLLCLRTSAGVLKCFDLRA